MSANGHVQIRDYSDRELLAIMLDLGDDVPSLVMAARIYGWSAIESEDKAVTVHGNRCVTSRLVWMRRYGLVTRNKLDGTWAVSAPGRAMLGAQLSKPVVGGIEHASDTHGLALANLVGERLVRAEEISGTAMRRELQFQIERRRRARRWA